MTDSGKVEPSAVPKVTLIREEAVALALAAANANPSKREFVALEERVTAYPFGWVVYVVPRRYQETGNSKDLVPGIGPVAVESRTRKVVFLSSSVPPDRAIAEFERRWKAEPGNR